MCKNTSKAIEFYDERMNDNNDISESLKEIVDADSKNEISNLIKDIEKSLKYTNKMKIDLANLIISKVTDYTWKDSLAYFENGGE